ncbi:MAG TPA: TIGR02996 domain-containing protein [Fimbriiglobus sp.]
MSQSHPDADALMRAVLRSPADAVARLVFADWLEETGQRGNVAWAKYIRFRAEAADADSVIAKDLARHKAAEVAPEITARLTLPAGQFVPHFDQFLNLLPAVRFTITLSGFAPPSALFREFREPLLRDRVVIPLAERDATMLLAGVRWAQSLQDDPQPIYSGPTVWVRALAEDILAALDAQYSRDRRRIEVQSSTSTPDTPKIHDPDAILSETTAWAGILRLIREAKEEKAGGVEIMATTADKYAIRFVLQGRPARRYAATHGWGKDLVEAAQRLKWDKQPGVRLRDRNTIFGPGARLVFDL